jgi:hypothetical protein
MDKSFKQTFHKRENANDSQICENMLNLISYQGNAMAWDII